MPENVDDAPISLFGNRRVTKSRDFPYYTDVTTLSTS